MQRPCWIALFFHWLAFKDKIHFLVTVVNTKKYSKHITFWYAFNKTSYAYRSSRYCAHSCFTFCDIATTFVWKANNKYGFGYGNHDIYHPHFVKILMRFHHQYASMNASNGYSEDRIKCVFVKFCYNSELTKVSARSSNTD